MNREQALRFLAALTASKVTTIGLEVQQSEHATLMAKTLRTFIDVFPERLADEFVYERLGRPANPSRLASFIAEVHALKGFGRAGETATQSHFRAVAFLLERAQQPIEHKPPETPRVIPRPSSRQALWCIAAVERLAWPEGLSSEERSRLKSEMTEVIAAWAEEVHLATEDGRCPDCASGYLQELDATAHVMTCTGHPAMAQLEAVRVAAQLGGAELEADVVDLYRPAPSRSAYGSAWEAADALAFLLESPAQRGARRRQPEHPVALLSRVGKEWAHFVDRTTDPCPWCGAVLPLAQFHSHLRSCDQHPAAQAAQRIRSSHPVPIGLERVLLARLSARRELALLSQASERFDADMGWTGEAGYSDKYSEAPWRAAIERAGKHLGLPERTPQFPRPEGSPVREAMTRLLSLTPQPRDVTISDIATIRAADAQFEDWVSNIGFATTCPACGRKGLPKADLAAHLESCPLHPAVRAARGVAALRQVREGVDVPPLQLGEYNPEDYRDRLSDYLRGKRAETLATLYEFEASELSKDQAADLLRFVRNWEELQLVAARPPCPWCGSAARGPEHLMVCTRHPAISEAQPRNQLEALALQLQFEADQCAVRLARLHEACTAFWNGMSDGDDGKSISNPRIEAMWSEARQEARDLLATIKERPSVGT
jgi:hypothetical protein